jgi:formylglycine-generating enzyme required for sulfatase activity
VFTFQLLQELKARAQDPSTVFTTTELYSSVFPAVSNQTNGKQKPLMAKFQYEGEFLFITGGGPNQKHPIDDVNTMASAVINTDPPGAKVFIDGGEQPVGTTPYTLSRDLGVKKTLDVEVGLKLDKHQQVVKRVTLRRGPDSQSTSNVLITLPPQIDVPIHDKPVITVDDPHRPPTKTNPVDNAVMIYIPEGEFAMGDPDRKDNPRHMLSLSGYYIYRDLVTVAQYKAFCQATNRPMPPAPLFDERWSYDDHPMVRVTWEDADAYCKWAGGHLPTEAQWEKAARGATTYKYAWGDKWDRKRVTDPLANQRLLDDIAAINRRKRIGFDRPGPGRRRPTIFDDTTLEENAAKDLRGTSAVGALSSAASPYGVLDLVGNVQQWCADWYEFNFWSGPKAADRDAGNIDGQGSQTRVRRGASWRDGDVNFRTSFRSRAKPTERAIDLGFRCVLDK